MTLDQPAPPVVVTLVLDPVAQEFFDVLRRKHFPAHRLVVGAHLTLFHALPGEALATFVQDAREQVPQAPFAVDVQGLRSLGGGVAYALESEVLTRLHRHLQRQWSDVLTRQDAQPLRAHVTVQNKVPAETARQTMLELAAVPRPERVTALGLRFWHYLGGPWSQAADVPFGAAPA